MPLTFSTEEKIACLEREIAIRRRSYPGKIQTGRMTIGKALEELNCLRAIAEDYREQLQRERLL